MVRRKVAWVTLPVACLSLFFLPAAAQRGTTVRVSVSNSGQEGNGQSAGPSVSPDGRYVAFSSSASNLIAGDTNSRADVFFHDRQTGATTRVSVSSSGQEGNDDSYDPSISADGRHVAFHSLASNLVAGDTNGYLDVFVHDSATGETTRVSISSSGQQGNGPSYGPSISADGQFVAFYSSANNLLSGYTSGYLHVYVHDRATRQTSLASVSSSGQHGNGWSLYPSISPDGRLVAFTSLASNLVSGDTNGYSDVFVHDEATGQTARVSASFGGQQGNGPSSAPSISADGRFVAFSSLASNLVSGDTNGNRDVFVHNRATGQTTRVSVSSSGQQGNEWSDYPSIGADGRFIAFHAYASNLVSGDTNGDFDVFVHDSATGCTTRVSVSSSAQQGNGRSEGASIGADGRFVAFYSLASNLVSGDTNGVLDVFVHQYGPDFVRVEPQSFTLFRGVLVSGAVSHLLESDDNRMVLRPGVVLSSAEAPIQLLLEGTAPAGTVTELRFSLEAHTNIPNIAQRIALFDFAANGWVELDSRLATTSDSVVEVFVVDNPARFIDPGTNALRARVAYKEAGPVFSYPWFARIDQTIWLIAQ